MEAMDLVVQNKKRSDSGRSSQDQDQDSTDDISLKRSVMMGKSKMETNEVDEEEDLKPSSSTHKALSSINKNEVLESVKAEMGQVMEENQRLRSHLGRLMKDYQALQSRFHEIAGAQHMEEKEANDQLSLSLGRNSSIDSKNKDDDDNSDKKTMSGLALALYSKQDQDQGGGGVLVPDSSTDNNSFEGPKEDESHRESWPPAPKVVPATRNGGGGDVDGAVQQPPVKKARVSVRARCDTPTMNDGCQWRKYGQKIAKGNPCPRAYYRCTVAPSCPVRKQVQRCVDDMSILITTYEGTHNHPLPISANAMANTTSAAAYMLTSGSSTSTNALGTSYYTTTTNSAITDLSSTLNFISSATRSRPPLLSSNINSFSTYPTSQPTITLDLTAASSAAPSTSTSDPFSRLGSTNSTTFAPRSSYNPYPNVTNLTFNSLDMSSNSTHPNPNCSTPNYTNTTQVGQPPLMTVGARPGPSHQDSLFYQALLQNMRNPSPNPNPSHGNCQPPQLPTPDSTVVAAARAITSDPSFQSVLTAALSSLITGNSSSGSGGDSSSSLTQKQLQK